MPARRKDEENLGRYIHTAKEFMNYEETAIEDYEMLCKMRAISIVTEVQRFIDFFKHQSFIGKPKSLIELYNYSFECKEQFGPITVANIFEFTEFRFKKYYEILSTGGYLYEQENNSKPNIS